MERDDTRSIPDELEIAPATLLAVVAVDKYEVEAPLGPDEGANVVALAASVYDSIPAREPAYRSSVRERARSTAIAFRTGWKRLRYSTVMTKVPPWRDPISR